jgi:hypothetical protein
MLPLPAKCHLFHQSPAENMSMMMSTTATRSCWAWFTAAAAAAAADARTSCQLLHLLLRLPCILFSTECRTETCLAFFGAPNIESLLTIACNCLFVSCCCPAEDWIDDDEYNRHKILLGLGSLLVAIGAPLLGCSAKKVDKARKQRK